MLRCESTESLLSSKSLSGNNTATTLFLVMFLAHYAKRNYRRGENEQATPKALGLLMEIVTTTLCQSKTDEFTALDCIMNVPMSKHQDRCINVSGVADERQGRNAIEAMGENYPSELRYGCNSKKYVMNCATAFEYMLRVGNVPFNILLAVAALLDDALCQGISVYHYKETDIGDTQRTRTTPQDRAKAFGRYICDVSKGVTMAMRRKKKECDMPMFVDAQDHEIDVPQGDDAYSGLLLGDSQACEGGDLVAGNPVLYKNVLREGAARL